MWMLAVSVLTVLQVTTGQMVSPSAATLRPMVVYQTTNAPVVIEQTETVDGRLHARVRVRSVSPRPIASITFVVTVGSPPGSADMDAVRVTEVAELSLAPGASTEVALRGISMAETDKLVPATTDRVAELGVVEVAFASRSSWRSLQKPGWLARPDVPVRLSCTDASLNVHSVGETVTAAEPRDCRADGVLVKRPVVER